MILSQHEIAELNKGPISTIKVGAHERKVHQRSPQVIKNRTIYTFAHTFLNQLERHGVSGQDRRHVKNLIALLKQHTR